MALKHFFHFILKEISAGTFWQNLAFYTLLALLVIVAAIQLKEKSNKYRVN
jgi:hypothetical protein